MNAIRRKLRIDTEVTVSSEGGWKNDFTGTISGGPESVETRQGEDYFYWVDFDTEQYDLTDGPYYKAQILSRYISPIKNKSVFAKFASIFKR